MSAPFPVHRDAGAPRVSSIGPPLAALIMLSAADAAISYLLLERGLICEVNPLMRAGIAHLGLPATVGLKLVLTAAAAGVLLSLRREPARSLPGVLWMAATGYALLWATALFLG
ncbi:MAG: hypothetical protein J7M38_14385 [Armatimonadetes bacterium]|nr:hypothetical protein [Armatimonadota bacterium]